MSILKKLVKNNGKRSCGFKRKAGDRSKSRNKYEVERIISKRSKNGKIDYLIKWMNFPRYVCESKKLNIEYQFL
jgi:hypothetical protein